MSVPAKAEIVQKLDTEWQALKVLVDSFTEEELQEAGVVEEWSVKDLMGHMAFWAHKAAGDLAKVKAGNLDAVETTGSQEGTDEWNSREAAARKGMSLSEVRAEWERSFEEARAAVVDVSAKMLELEVEVKGWTMFDRFAEDTYRHYREHAAQIRAWQQSMETTEA